MKKIHLLIVLFLAAATLVQAQRREPVHPEKDKVEYQGYTIRLMPTMGGYGYYTLLKGELVAQQDVNPFNMDPMGLNSKEDAYKVAKWQVDQFKKHGHRPQVQLGGAPGMRKPGPAKAPQAGKKPGTPLESLQVKKIQATFNQRIPLKVAEELQIKTNRHSSPKH